MDKVVGSDLCKSLIMREVRIQIPMPAGAAVPIQTSRTAQSQGASPMSYSVVTVPAKPVETQGSAAQV
jgi:hypothetical protein